MASETANPSPAPAAQVVASAFVEQYYPILHQSPGLVYRFYQDSSVLSRPGPNGEMTSVTTMDAINEKILSLNSKEFKVELRTVDAQDSYKGGVTVLVTGWHTGSDDVRRKFIQSFFLAPQDRGYFVLNDIFRYMNEDVPLEQNSFPANSVNVEAPKTSLTPDQVSETSPGPDHYEPVEEVTPSEDEVDEKDVGGNETEEAAVEEEVVPPAPTSQEEVSPPVEMATVVEEDAPKRSYASIVKVMKESKASVPATVSSTVVRAAPSNVEKQSLASSLPAIETPAPSSNSVIESSNHPEEESHSIYVRSLPLNIIDTQLEEEFKKFGPIKPGGVQVRSNKQGFCFGFVEFESAASVRSAIEASPIIIGGKPAFVEEKRTQSRVTTGGIGRGAFPTGRGASTGGFRSDSFRGRTSFGGRGSFGRNEYANRGRGSSRREGGYQRVDQNGRAGGGRSGGGMNQNTIPT